MPRAVGAASRPTTPHRASPSDLSWQVLSELTDALRDGDAARLARVLAPDVVFTSDGAGQVTAAVRPLLGFDAVAKFLLGLVSIANRHGAAFVFEPVLVNGDPATLARFDSPRPRDPRVAVYSFVVRDGRIVAIYAQLAPDKLTRVPPPAG